VKSVHDNQREGGEYWHDKGRNQYSPQDRLPKQMNADVPDGLEISVSCEPRQFDVGALFFTEQA
jgi:hypothetical protein